MDIIGNIPYFQTNPFIDPDSATLIRTFGCSALWHWFDSIVSDTEFTHINYIYILYTTITYSKIQGSTSSLPAITHMITHLKRLNKVVVPQTATLLRMLHLNQIQLISPMGDLSIWKISSCLWMVFVPSPNGSCGSESHIAPTVVLQVEMKGPGTSSFVWYFMLVEISSGQRGWGTSWLRYL